MNYIGSKQRLSGFIRDTVHAVAGADLTGRTFCDIFAGTGAVGRMFKREVKQVIANDAEYYSYVLNKNYIENHREIRGAQKSIDELNALPLVTDGFIYRNYCLGGGSGRQYFSDGNGQRIDTIRQGIERYRDRPNLYWFLLASLLECADRVANTASVYGAYLKELKKTAQRELILTPAWFETNDNEHQVFCEQSNELIRHIEGDILYLDPPYNARQYGANYHLLNTIARCDNFVPQGKTGLREYRKSSYCSRANVEQALENLVRDAKFEYIFLSYNNEGLMSEETIRRVMSRYGRYDCETTDYQRFKADSNRHNRATGTTEYLHILEKR